MYWRVAHHTIKWAGAGLFSLASFVVLATLAASAVWPAAKSIAETKFAWIIYVMTLQWVWALAFLFILVWVAALIWTGHRAGLYHPPGPPATQDRKQAISPRPAKRATDSIIEEYDRLSRWAEADARVANAARLAGPIRDRDTGIEHALGYAIHANWEMPVGYGQFITIPPIDLDRPIERFREAALAGELRVWGRRQPNGLIEEIKQDFWGDNTIDETAIRALFGQSRTIPFEDAKTAGRFYGIMVNRAEVERVWPHAG